MTDLSKPTHHRLTDEIEQRTDELLLDRIDSLKVLRADTAEEKGALLEQIAGAGKVEQDIVKENSKIKPLWRPDRFEEAHRLAMRSLEVLDRNGGREPRLGRLGPLKPVASYVVQQMTRYIVKAHQNTLILRVRKLYERREANCVWGTPEHHMLRRARINASQVEKGYTGKALGLPTALLGGAALSSIVSGLRWLIDSTIQGAAGAIALVGILGLVFLGLAWAALFAAGTARRRIRLATDQPMQALYETIGACGNPPKDRSYDFATYAIVLLALAWILIPLVFFIVLHQLRH